MDNAGEFIGRYLQVWFTESGIMYEYYQTDSPKPKGRTERLNRTILDKTREMINHLGASYNNIWVEDVATAKYIWNRMYSKGCQREGVTPIEALTGIN